MLLIFFMYALFAVALTVVKMGLVYAQPIFFSGVRTTSAGILILSYLYFFNRGQIQFSRKSVKTLFSLAFFGSYLVFVCEFWALQYLTSFKIGFIYSLCPFITVLLSYLIFSEKMTLKKWIGMVIGFVGIIPLLIEEDSDQSLMTQIFFLSFAELVAIGSAICTAYGWILIRSLVKKEKCAPLFVNGFSMFVGGCFALIHSFFVEDWNPFPVTEWAPFLVHVALLVILSNFIAYNLYGNLLKKFTATFISFAGWSAPFFVAFFGWLFLGEVVTLSFFISAGIVLVGLMIFYEEELAQGYIVTEKSEEGVKNLTV